MEGNYGEHWLNGVKILEFNLDTPEFADAFQKSKFVNFDGFAKKRKGHIIITDHTDDSWYRNIKIKKLK
ncbi:MAG: DUF1080 domain-containing protein [Bacteroidales bacterium]|nr:DUF1080 domain-containing protein [Bacteroidales bacterium]